MSGEDRWGWLCAAGLGLFAVVFMLTQCSSGSSDDDSTKGPIPERFQGAYNSLGCGSTAYIDGLVTVGGASIHYGGAVFEAEEMVTQTDSAVTVRGRPIAAGGTEPSRTFTITYSPVGGMASLDGGSFRRCSQY